MFNFLKSKKAHDHRDLEQLIFDVAEHQSDKDFHLLYKLMVNRTVFVPAETSTIPASAVPGEKYLTKRGDRISMRYVAGPNNLLFVPAATQEILPILKDGYLGMEWFDYLNMVLKLDESFYGALLQGKTSWVAFDRERIRYILGHSSA